MGYLRCGSVAEVFFNRFRTQEIVTLGDVFPELTKDQDMDPGTIPSPTESERINQIVLSLEVMAAIYSKELDNRTDFPVIRMVDLTEDQQLKVDDWSTCGLEDEPWDYLFDIQWKLMPNWKGRIDDIPFYDTDL